MKPLSKVDESRYIVHTGQHNDCFRCKVVIQFGGYYKEQIEPMIKKEKEKGVR